MSMRPSAQGSTEVITEPTTEALNVWSRLPSGFRRARALRATPLKVANGPQTMIIPASVDTTPVMLAFAPALGSNDVSNDPSVLSRTIRFRVVPL